MMEILLDQSKIYSRRNKNWLWKDLKDKKPYSKKISKTPI